MTQPVTCCYCKKPINLMAAAVTYGHQTEVGWFHMWCRWQAIKRWDAENQAVELSVPCETNKPKQGKLTKGEENNVRP